MNISYNWLKDLIDIRQSPEHTAKALTRVGLAVEGIHPHGDDYVFDIDLTSNRPDCLSHLGVARELSVGSGLPVSVGEHRTSDGSGDPLGSIPFPAVLAPEVVKIEDPELCHRFTARIIRGVKIGPSPEWLVNRLEAIGERSINNVADVTNYVMHELGQPMHAFDLNKLSQNRIVVRTARAGEMITTLDEVERKLDETMLAICDAEKPVAVAGIMGGIDSSISDTTTDVLLEVAYFQRDSIRRTSRKLGLATEASYRFERGVDIENLIAASDRAAELIVKLAGGVSESVIDTYPKRYSPGHIDSPDIAAAVKRLTGLDVTTEECLRILSSLGIQVVETSKAPGSLKTFASPSWRHDLAIEEDLVEEIVRHVGYENISDELPPAYGAGEYQPTEHREKEQRNALSTLGFDEALSYSFIDTAYDGSIETVPGFVRSDIAEPYITLRDSVIEGAVRMRPTLIIGLMAAVRHNFNQQRRDLRLFELGKVFAANGAGEIPNERELFALVVTGGAVEEGRALPTREIDFYDAKGGVEAALEAAGAQNVEFAAADIGHLRSGQSAAIMVGGRAVGSVGRLNEEISTHYKFNQPVYVAEFDLQSVLETESKPSVYTPLPKFPAIIRDVSFAVSRSVAYADVRSAAAAIKPELCRRISFVDLFEGVNEPDKRSLTIRFEYRSDDRTLAESDIETVHADLVEKLQAQFGQ